MSTERTTIVLDSKSRAAARKIASLLGCSQSEVIRKALTSFESIVFGVPLERREVRTQALLRLIELCDGMDAEEEVRRIKEEREWF